MVDMARVIMGADSFMGVVGQGGESKTESRLRTTAGTRWNPKS